MMSTMSPRPADPAVRLALIETAARLIAHEGVGGLTLRRLVDEVGTSTMAVYTHFGGMDELRREVRREGFVRLAVHLAQVQGSRDPVADLVRIGLAYHRSATANPNLYRVMFLEKALDQRDATVGDDAFGVLVDGVDRCVAAGRFDPADPLALATQLWAVTHGLVTLELFGHLPRAAVLDCLDATARNLFRAYGDDPRAIGRSVAAAGRRWASDGH